MTTFEYTITLDDSEEIILENLLKNTIAYENAEESDRANLKMEFVGISQCESILNKLHASIKDAVMSSTSSFCK